MFSADQKTRIFINLKTLEMKNEDSNLPQNEALNIGIVMQRFDTEKYIGMVFNGYKWFSHYKGVHRFQKRTNDRYRWMLIECTEEQLYNGDIEFMAENGWTLSKERKREANKSYDAVNVA